MTVLDPQVRLLRALSGLSRASRDLDALGEAGEAEGFSVHAQSGLWELGVEVAYGVRRLAYVGRLLGINPDAIEKARQQ